MKVAAFNGSPHANGNTYLALRTVADVLESNGIEVELIHIGDKAVRGCMGCNACAKNRDQRCVLPDDGVNEWVQKMIQADGILLGSPVHYSNLTGVMKCFLDRAAYVAGNSGGLLRHKVGAAITAVRRTGGMPTVDAMNRYITYSEMIIPSSNYWNVVHGMRPGEIEQDAEGMQILRVLGENMAWLMKVLDNGKQIFPPPAWERKQLTNFIRKL